MATLGEQALGIYLADDHLLFKTETLAAGKQGAVLVDEGIACKHHVLSGFAKAAGAIDVAGDAAGTLLTDEGEQVLVLADEFVGSTQVEDDFCPFQCQFAAGRNGCPEVFADFDAEAGLLGVEEQIAPEWHELCAEMHLGVFDGSRRCEPTLLVEFLVVGQESFGHDT